MAKELSYKKQGTKKAKDVGLSKLKASTGQAIDGNDFLIPEDVVNNALGNKGTQVMRGNELHPDQPVKNILAITSKSTRKTKITKFGQHYLLSKFPGLQTQDLRRTKELSMGKLAEEHMDSLAMGANEYNVPGLRETIQKAANKIYFVRDKKRKDNQAIEFSSFDGIASQGGFTQPYFFHGEELVDPNSKGSAPSKEEFEYVYDLVNSKNRENFMSFGKNIYDVGATNMFTMNRGDDDHPLISFAEDHCPGNNVKDGMKDDLLENNFFVHYVGDTHEGGEFMKNTLIVYASKFSNEIFAKDEEGVDEQLKLVESGDQHHLGIILGDTFEGDFSNNRTYTFTEDDATGHTKLPTTPLMLHIGIDKDKNEEIPITPSYLLKFEDTPTLLKYGKPVYAVITDKQIQIPSNKKIGNAEIYYEIVKNKLLEVAKNNQSTRKEIVVFLDDDQKLGIDRFNRDEKLLAAGFRFTQAKKHAHGDIDGRVSYIEDNVPLGFESFIECPENRILVKEITKVKNNDSTGKRDERKSKNKLNKINSKEYSSYVFSTYKHTFPQGFGKGGNEEREK